MMKILTMGASGLIGIALLGMQPPESQGQPGGPPPPPPPPKKKGDGGPAGDLRQAYELLRRIKAPGGPPESIVLPPQLIIRSFNVRPTPATHVITVSV